jgi:hypothetical protein
MKFIAIMALLAFITTAAMAQNRANIQGKVVDSASNEVLELATVAVVNPIDSSLISYTVTNKAGEFTLHNLPADKTIKLVISFVTYNNFRKNLNLKKGETLQLGAIKIAAKTNDMSEVKISGEVVPIVVKKDTIEFNAEAFKTPPNAVVEDLLKRLPGLEVDMNGNITVNGKSVKLKVDGKEFFSNDPRIASKNLDADLIAKVQVYDDREDDPDHLIPDAKVNKIINLKLKSAIKKSVGGKLHGGAGTRDRYDAGLIYNMFRDTLQISLIGIANNLNRTGFSQGDLSSLAGFNRNGTDVARNLNLGGRGSISTIGSGGANINTDYGKKLKVNLLYYYSHSSNINNNSEFSQQFIKDTVSGNNTTISSNYFVGERSHSNTHTISSLVEMNPDSTVKIRYQPVINISNSGSREGYTNDTYNNFVPKLNGTVYSSNDQSENFQFQHTFSYYHTFHKKGESLNITHNLNISPGSGKSYSLNDITSYVPQIPSSRLDRLADNANRGSSASANITYRNPFSKKLTGDVQFFNNFNYNNGRMFTYDANPQTGLYDIYIDSLSRDLVRKQFTETVRPELTYNFTKQARLIASLGVQFMQTYNRFNKGFPDINRFSTYLLPALSFSNSKFSVSYDVSVRQPDINSMRPDTTVYNQLSSSAGNPLLKPTRSHSLNVGLYLNKSERMLSTNINGYFSIDENSIFSQRQISSQGISFSRPINKTGSYYSSVTGTESKSFKKFDAWQIRLTDRLTMGYQHNFFQVNGQEGFQNTLSGVFSQQVFANWNNKFEINPTYTISPSFTSYQDVNYKNIRYATQSLYIPTVIKMVKHMTFEANYSYKYNPQVTPGQQRSSNVLNLSVARQFQFRDRGEIKISCFDLFDQSIDSYRYVGGNYLYDIQQQILRRYFLLSYSYRFSSTTTKK